MKLFPLFIITALAVLTAGAQPVPPSTAFTRDLLRSTNAAEFTAKVGVGLGALSGAHTNNMTGVATFGNLLYVTNAAGLGASSILSIGGNGISANQVNLYAVAGDEYHNADDTFWYDENNTLRMQLTTSSSGGTLTLPGSASIVNASNVSGTIITGNAMYLTNTPVHPESIGRAMPLPMVYYNPIIDFGLSATSTNITNMVNILPTNAPFVTAVWKDDGWQNTNLDVNGLFVCNSNFYPAGILAINNFVHSKNWTNSVLGTGSYETGTYTSVSTNACSGRAGTPLHLIYAHVQQLDALGEDNIKVDICNLPAFDRNTYNEIFRGYGNAILNLQARGSTNQMGFMATVFLSGQPAEAINECNILEDASAVRTDVRDVMNRSYTIWRQSGAEIRSGHGQEVGWIANTGGFGGPITTNVAQATLAMSAILCAPLGVGVCTNGFENYYTNAEVYAYYYDPAVIPGKMIATNGFTQVWSRPIGRIGSGTNLLAIANYGGGTSNVTVNLALLGYPTNTPVMIRNLYTQSNAASNENSFTFSAPSNNVYLFVVAPLPTDVYATKVSGTSRTSTTTLADDADFTVSVFSNHIYTVTHKLLFTSADNTPGFKYAFSLPTPTIATVTHSFRIPANTFSTGGAVVGGWVTDGTTEIDAANTGIATYFDSEATLVLKPTVDGVIKIRWAQFSSSGTALVLNQGSYMRVTMTQ